MKQEFPTWRIWLLLLLATALQTTWFSGLQPGGSHVDLPLLTCTSISLLLGGGMGAAYGLGAGLAAGFCAGTNVGSFALSRLVAGGLFGLFDHGFSRDSALAPPLCAAGAVVLSNLVFLVMSPLDFTLVWWLAHTAARALSHAVLIWPVHLFIQRIVLPPSRRMFV
jgi:LytS/YehU family sensor histidine kinase